MNQQFNYNELNEIYSVMMSVGSTINRSRQEITTRSNREEEVLFKACQKFGYPITESMYFDDGDCGRRYLVIWHINNKQIN